MSFDEIHNSYQRAVPFKEFKRLDNYIRYLRIRTIFDPKVSRLKDIKQELSEFLVEHHIQFPKKVSWETIVGPMREVYERKEDITDEELDDLVRRAYRIYSANLEERMDRLIESLREVSEHDEWFENGWRRVRGDRLREFILKGIKFRSPRRMITSLEELIRLINNEKIPVAKGWVIISWYDQYSTLIVEHFIKRHEKVVPTVREMRYANFFVTFGTTYIPMDLKITYIPDGYIKERNLKGVEDALLKVREDPLDLARWLYENQGRTRFDDNNRLYIVVRDWKLKANVKNIEKQVLEYLNKLEPQQLKKVKWSYDTENYENITDVIIIE